MRVWCLFLCLIFGFSPSAALAEQVSATVLFRVFGDGWPVGGAQILLIDNQGRLIQQGTTNEAGILRVPVRVDKDPRFPSDMKFGTVTAIAVANGFNERVVFEVPVHDGAGQTVWLEKIRNGRNEPSYELGQLHRHDVFRLVDFYAEQAGLKRQPPNAEGYAPWGVR